MQKNVYSLALIKLYIEANILGLYNPGTSYAPDGEGEEGLTPPPSHLLPPSPRTNLPLLPSKHSFPSFVFFIRLFIIYNTNIYEKCEIIKKIRIKFDEKKGRGSKSMSNVVYRIQGRRYAKNSGGDRDQK